MPETFSPWMSLGVWAVGAAMEAYALSSTDMWGGVILSVTLREVRVLCTVVGVEWCRAEPGEEAEEGDNTPLGMDLVFCWILSVSILILSSRYRCRMWDETQKEKTKICHEIILRWGFEGRWDLGLNWFIHLGWLSDIAILRFKLG